VESTVIIRSRQSVFTSERGTEVCVSVYKLKQLKCT